MPGQLRALRSRSGGSPLQGKGRLGALVPATTGSAPGRDDDRVGIGHGRIEQIDLRTDDPVESDLLGGTHEADRAVQSVVISDGEPGQALGDGSLDKIVPRRRTVEEREVGVRVELGVRSRRHVDRLVSGGERGLDSIERMFISCT